MRNRAQQARMPMRGYVTMKRAAPEPPRHLPRARLPSSAPCHTPTPMKGVLVDYRLVLLIIAYVFAVITGLVIAYLLALPRARFLSAVGAILFAALAGAGIYAFAITISLDP